MIMPPSLQIGDMIGIMAPSSHVERGDIEAGCAALEAHGFQTYIHPQTFERLNQSAGTHEQKARAFHDLVKNPDIRGVIFAGGGNRALHLLDYLDFDLIRAHPKIYMGFSDATALLNAIHARTGLVTYHGPLAKYLAHNAQLDFNLRFLKGEEDVIPLTGAVTLRKGKTEGWLIGGNLSVFRRLSGSMDMPDVTGAVLFLEDTGEETSRLDAEFCYLRRCGIFDKISGLVLGQFDNLKDSGRPFGFTFEDIIAEHTNGLSIPVLANAPFGHDKNSNIVLPIGARVRLEEISLRLLQAE